MSDATGRTGFRVTHTKAVGERRAIVHEMMRELDPKAVEYWARENTNIVVEDEVLDRAFVNDGTGKFVRATSMQQVLDYGQSRVDRLSSPLREDKPDKNGKMRGGTVTTSMFVAHLPKSMCKEVPDFYGKGRSRWVARDRDEAQRYFADVVRFLGNNVVPGGFDGILGFDIQHSETTPHIQLLADTFADDPKHPGSLRSEWSRAFASHRSMRDDEGKMLTGRAKMSKYQDDLKEYMVGRGWPVEREVDPLRHDKTETKATYGKLKDEQRAIDEQREQLKVDRDGVLRDWDELEREEYRVNLARKEVEQERTTAREEGRKQGYEQGLAEGRVEAQRFQQVAREQLARADKLYAKAMTARSIPDEQARHLATIGARNLATVLGKHVDDAMQRKIEQVKLSVERMFAKNSEGLIDEARKVERGHGNRLIRRRGQVLETMDSLATKSPSNSTTERDDGMEF